jgi:hypothetical protein
MHLGVHIPLGISVKRHISRRLAHRRHLAVPYRTLDIIGAAFRVCTEYQDNRVKDGTHDDRDDGEDDNQFYQ